MSILQKIKNFLKRFLPPPTRTFLRETDSLRRQIETLSRRLDEETRANALAQQQLVQMAQQQMQTAQQQMQTAQQQLLRGREQSDEQLAALLQNNSNQLQRLQRGLFRTAPQPRLSYFVLNILDHCNLRCRGCDHFAAIAEKRFVALEDISADLQKMSALTEGRVTRIGVMGGEPLLHPQLKEILAEARRNFPDTLIQVVSNGLLMNQQADTFWEACRDNRIEIVVTKYPIELDFEKMEETAQKWGVAFRYYGDTGEVIKTSYKMSIDVAGRQDPTESFWDCYHANQLPLLMEGKFYPCTVAPNVRHFNKKFGTNMALEAGDYLELDKVSSADELYQFLCTPKPFCRYCKTKERTFGHPWGRSEQKMEEWI